MTVTTYAGHLASVVSDSSITQLTIKGTIDARDFKFITDALENLKTLDLSEAYIVAYNSTLDDQLIAGVYSYPAKTLPYCALTGMVSLTSLTLPSNLIAIDYGALAGCSKLASIELPPLKSIGDDAFNGCKQLDKIILPASLTSLGNYAFAYCDSVKSVTFLGNNDITLTGESHFSSLKKLKSVKLPDGLTLITRSMFYGCEQLETIDLSRTHVAEIRPYAFYNNKVLTAVQFPTTLTTIGEQAFYNNNIRHLQLPDGLQTIGNYTFAESKDLSAAPVLLPQSLTAIGEHAFYNCNRLTAVTFHPLSSLSLGGYIFDDCDSLRAVHFPNDLATIPRGRQDRRRGSLPLFHVALAHPPRGTGDHR